MSSPGWMRALPGGKPVSALGFGCSSLFAKPGFDEARAQALLLAAHANGINLFDTSPSYGPGHGERRLGDFLKGRDPAEFVVTTKVGNNLIDGAMHRSFDSQLMERSLLGSLDRLGLEKVDVLFLHGPTLRDLNSTDVQSFFDAQKAAGRIALAGVECKDASVIEATIGTGIDVVMTHFNAANPELEPLVERLHHAGKLVIAGTVLAQMKFDLAALFPRGPESLWYLLRQLKHDPLFWRHGPALARRLAASGKTPVEAAIEYVVSNPAVTAGMFGSANPEHVAANATAGRRVFQQQVG